MHCNKVNRYLVRKTLFFNILFVLCSSSAMSFSSLENSVKIESNSNGCIDVNYEEILTRIENFASYREIDDHIVWPNVRSWLSAAVESVLPGVLERFLDIKPLDMTMSEERECESSQGNESGRSRACKVWMAFSPLELPRSLHAFYPKIPLMCSIREDGEGHVIHRCDQVEGLTYAVQSFSSLLQISKHDCGVKSFFRIVFNLHRDHVEAIYESIIDYYEWPTVVLRIMQRADKTELFSLYFQNLYNQLLLL